MTDRRRKRRGRTTCFVPVRRYYGNHKRGATVPDPPGTENPSRRSRKEEDKMERGEEDEGGMWKMLRH